MAIAHRTSRAGGTLAVLACLWHAGCGDPEGSPGDATPSDAGMEASSHGDGAPSDSGEDSGLNWPDGAPPDADSSVEDGGEDAGGDASIIEQALCPPEAQVSDGCMSLPNGEGAAEMCDGLDNDCDGRVDDGCHCNAGEVQRCFDGPPGRAGVGACRYGTQVCQGFEFPAWGACVGGGTASEEQCDGIDNDCNGCADELEECTKLVDCPLPGDPRIGTAEPFSEHTFDADQFVNPSVVESYSWEVEGTPCDRMFRRLRGGGGSRSGKLSYTLRNGKKAQAQLEVTLSGEYAVELAVELVNGETVTCSFPFVVGAPGLRVELCWPESGPSSPDDREVDLDLHLGREGFTEQWNDDLDCHWSNCPTLTQYVDGMAPARGLWGAAPTDRRYCTGPGLSDLVNDFVTRCPNPRLDVDSFQVSDDRFPTENINLERVGNGHNFRVAVLNQDCSSGTDCVGRVAHPLVNVYCDSRLEGTFQLPVGEVDSFGLGNGGDAVNGVRDVWRVVDIAATKPDGNLECDLTPLTNDAGTGPWIEAGPDGGTLPY